MYFKVLTSTVILKSNKESYNSSKAFRPIVLLNTISQLIEKVTSKILQFKSISKDFIYSCQLGSLKQHSTTDTGVALTYFIYTGWIKNILTSTLAFDITQFFPLLNYQILSLILDKAEFDSKILSFFHNYLVCIKTIYLWNNYFSSLFNVNIGVG